MKKRLLFILCFSLAASAFAQTKTITNADLEKYRQKRLQAEREYAENYERLGLLSPAELEQRRIQSIKERSELAQRLERERLEREYYEQQQPVYVIQSVTVNNRRSRSPYFYNYAPYGFYNFNFPRTVPRNQYPKFLTIKPPIPIRTPFSDRRKNQ